MRSSMRFHFRQGVLAKRNKDTAQAMLPTVQKKRMKFFLLPLVSAMEVSMGEIKATMMKATPSA